MASGQIRSSERNRTMARPSPKKRKGQHGDAIAHLPGDPEIITHGSGGGGGAGGPKSLTKAGSVQASIKGKVKGMGGK